MEARSGIRRFLKMRKMFNSQLEEKLKTKVSSKFMWILNKSCVSHLTLDKLLNWLLRGLGLQGTIGLLRDVKPHISHDGWNIATSFQTIFSCLKIFIFLFKNIFSVTWAPAGDCPRPRRSPLSHVPRTSSPSPPEENQEENKCKAAFKASYWWSRRFLNRF